MNVQKYTSTKNMHNKISTLKMNIRIYTHKIYASRSVHMRNMCININFEKCLKST